MNDYRNEFDQMFEREKESKARDALEQGRRNERTNAFYEQTVVQAFGTIEDNMQRNGWLSDEAYGRDSSTLRNNEGEFTFKVHVAEGDEELCVQTSFSWYPREGGRTTSPPEFLYEEGKQLTIVTCQERHLVRQFLKYFSRRAAAQATLEAEGG